MIIKEVPQCHSTLCCKVSIPYQIKGSYVENQEGNPRTARHGTAYESMEKMCFKLNSMGQYRLWQANIYWKKVPDSGASNKNNSLPQYGQTKTVRRPGQVPGSYMSWEST